MKKSYLIIIILCLIIAIMGFMWYNSSRLFKSYETSSSEVLLEEVARVFKLVAVEGHVSEIYNYKQYNYWDLPFLRKQALIRVKAKVSVGYDFENVEFIIQEDLRTIRIKSFPDPEILSVDHDLDYYNIQEGVFNSFGADELTTLNDKAKEFIIDLIRQGPLFEEAEAQKETLTELLSTIFDKTGWRLVIEDKTPALLN
ncbi:MAG: DUF4230 domain-containing protein [Saprospiraceae bacterium]|nr:DUF4230 domain-containing protein [Saprospiraceae bacterium]